MNKDNFCYLQGVLFVLSLAVLLASFYFELIKGLQPCPLCLMQRAVVLCLVVSTVIGIFINAFTAKKRLIWIQWLLCLAGIYFAGRQLWLQLAPNAEAHSCLPSLNMLMKYFPWRDILQALLLGAADCGEVTWTWLGLSMPAWSAVYFVLCFVSLVFYRYRLSKP